MLGKLAMPYTKTKKDNNNEFKNVKISNTGKKDGEGNVSMSEGVVE